MFLIDEIVSIENYESNSKRYDIEVENNHNFFANNILVHNCQSLSRTLESFRDIEFGIEEKTNGSSCSIFYRTNPYTNEPEQGVCSRNLELRLDQEGNAFIDTVKLEGWLDHLSELGMNIAIQGELVGPKLQGNIYKLSNYKIFVFDVWFIDEQRYATRNERLEILEKLKDLGVEVNQVPYLGSGPLPEDILDVLKWAEGKSSVSTLGPNQRVEREGIVFKSAHLVDGQIMSFKAISNKYLLNERETEL